MEAARAAAKVEVEAGEAVRAEAKVEAGAAEAVRAVAKVKVEAGAVVAVRAAAGEEAGAVEGVRAAVAGVRAHKSSGHADRHCQREGRHGKDHGSRKPCHHIGRIG